MAKNLMIQGTMSNAGKSIITAGILRILAQDGYKAAPFKSQNMALNSYITKDGLEMGRAQAMQAQAAKIEPDIAMNPILLKPNSEMGSQVIVNGEVLGNKEAREYFKMKKALVPDILKAYEKLDKEYDYVIIEGAGSPAEINLKKNDIVNMGLAELVDAPVLLVGDIDRGGVFAQLLGTIWLLEEKERERVKGLIINKFRGDKTILDPGLEQLYEKCHIPVTGVIPYIHADIDDEDSLSERLNVNTKINIADIAVIHLPHISNFTDFNILDSVEGVGVRYVKNPAELKKPDILIIPGSKNTMSDLMWLRQSGLEAAIVKMSHVMEKEGGMIFGICGGYQMLGESISDPYNIEHGGEIAGMGLLPVKTVYAGSKHRTRVKGSTNKMSGIFEGISCTEIEGYEIHMGETVRNGGEAFAFITDSVSQTSYEDGCIVNNICGTYIHGVFDSDELLNKLIAPVFVKKGADLKTSVSVNEYKERQYDILAEAIRQNIDMDALYRILDRR